MKQSFICVCYVLASLSPLSADVIPSVLFSDNAVLQRDKPIAVFGRADPGETVTVGFKGQQVSGQTDAQGRWQLTLNPLPADATPASLTIAGKNTIVLNNIVVGDVWVCAGQSNMSWSVRTALNPEQEIAASENPLIRHIKIPQIAASTPQTSLPKALWQVASPSTTGEFSAPGYFMARALQKELEIPIGLLNISYGGTLIEAWMSPQAIAQNPQQKGVMAQWKRVSDAYPARHVAYEKAIAQWRADRAAGKPVGRSPRAPEGPGSRQEPSSLYNAMVAPVLPYGIAGIIWYQGEANAPRHTEYADLIRGLIRQWRADFMQGDVPFYYVELANNNRLGDKSGYQWAYQREAQRAALKEPNTAYVTAIDIGQSDNAHFKDKQSLGQRLAWCALKHHYGQSIEASGPQFEGADFAQGEARVRFSHAEGLHLGEGIPSFELAGGDGVFYPGQATVQGESVIVKSAQVPTPTTVRYCFRTDPSGWAILRNNAGLPASPLRTDTYPEPAASR